MIYMVDIDGTICNTTNSEYECSVPYRDRIEIMNDLYDQGNEVHYWTARGGSTGKDWSELTRRQLQEWNVKYTSLRMKKPSYDVWIDDKAVNGDDFFKKNILDKRY